MKYINHMTSSVDDEKHSMAIHKMGLAAYGAYWIIVEKIASQIRPESASTSIRVHNELWASWLRTRIDHALRLLRTLHDSGLIICEFTNGLTSVSVPNILKYGDEYTKRVFSKSSKTPDNIPIVSGSPAVPAVPAEQTKQKPRAKKESPAFVLPPSIRPEVWAAFEEHRKKKRAPLTDHARKLTVESCGKIGGDPNELLEHAILRGWQTVFPIKGNGATPPDPPKKRKPTTPGNCYCGKLGATVIGGEWMCDGCITNQQTS